jgi:hypothetical protein
LQATAPVSSSKWTLGIGVVAALSFAAGRNWNEKEYYRAKSGMNAKRVNAIETWTRDPNAQANPGTINSIYTYAFEAINGFSWKCKRDEFEDLVKARDRICHFMRNDRALTNASLSNTIKYYCSPRLSKGRIRTAAIACGNLNRTLVDGCGEKLRDDVSGLETLNDLLDKDSTSTMNSSATGSGYT